MSLSPHFTGEETKVQRHETPGQVSEWWSWDLNPDHGHEAGEWWSWDLNTSHLHELNPYLTSHSQLRGPSPTLSCPLCEHLLAVSPSPLGLDCELPRVSLPLSYL